MGETIRIKQQFTEAVEVNGSDLSIEIDLGERLYGTTRDADYASGSGTDTLTFEYDVKWFDIDKDGIGISDGRHDGEATIVTEDDSTEVNYNYEAIKMQPNQKVSGKPFVEDVNISSTPAGGDTYRKGENIEIQVQFNRAVQVNELARVKAQIGEGADALTNFPYSSGSGTDTLAFRHEVATDDSDPDGVALDDGDPDSDYFYYEFSGSGTVTENGGELLVSTEYQVSFTDPQPGHKVDGSPYVTGIAVTSTPPNGTHYRIGDEIEITATFDQDLSADPPLAIPLTIGDGFSAGTWVASYSSDSQGNKLVFSHRVGKGQRDDDGISISAGRRILDIGRLYADGSPVSAHRDIPGLPDQAGHKVYGFLPVVRSSEITSSPAMGDSYRKGEAVEISLTFNLDTAITEGQAVTVSYDNLFKDSLPAILLDEAGNSLDSFSAQPVTNNSEVAEYTGALWPVLSSHGLTIPEGGSGSYTVALDSEPGEDATVTLSIKLSGRLTASPGELTFTTENWATPQTVTLTAAEDRESHDSWHEIIHASGVRGFVVGHTKVLTEGNE